MFFKRASYLGIAAAVALLTACTGNLPQSPNAPAAVGAPPVPRAAATPVARPPVNADAGFVRAAAQIEAGRYALAALGLKKAQTSALQRLARELSSNATASSRWLAGYARKHGMPVKTRPKTRAMYQYSQMMGLTGGAFDRAFAQAVSIDAALSLDRFQAAARDARDPALRAFAKRAAAQLQVDAQPAGG